METKNWFKEGNDLFDNENYSEALDCYEKWLDTNNVIFDELTLGIVLGNSKKALQANPYNVKALLFKGIAFDELKNHSEAIECFDNAIMLKPDYTRAYKNKGHALYNLGNYQDAIECYSKTIELDSNDSFTHRCKGDAFYNLGSYQDAIKCYDKALEINPNDVVAYSSREYAYKNRPSITTEVARIEGYMIEKATKINSLTELYNFYFAQCSVFLPTLEYAVHHLNENTICKLANFGILVDQLSQNQIRLLIQNNIDLTAQEISKRTGKRKSSIIRGLDNISIAQKAQMTTVLVSLGSVTRDVYLLDATSKFSIQNQTILWANLFGHFFSFPVMADMYLNEDMINDAEKSLKQTKSLISDKTRTFDALFAMKYPGLYNLSEKNITNIPKYFIGTKLNWLSANEGLFFCKYLITKNKKYLEKSLDFNKRIESFLKNERVSKNEWSYRNFDTQGPSPNLLKLLQSKGESWNIYPISTIEWLVITNDNQCFVVDIPSNFSFYFSPEMTVTYSDENGKVFTVNASQDVGSMIDFGQNPADYVANCLSQLSSPKESIALSQVKYKKELIERYLASEDSAIAHLEVAYNKALSSPIVDIVKKGTRTGFESLLAYGFLTSLESLAKASGIETNAESWIQIRTIVSSVFVGRLAYLLEKQRKKEVEEKEAKQEEAIILSPDEKIEKLYSKITESGKEFEQAFKEIEDDGLLEIFNLSNKMQEIILSGLSPEEIKMELEKYLNV